MENEIIKLLKREGKLSDEAFDEHKSVGLNSFSDIIKEVGKEPTEYIKVEDIQEDLNTDFIGKNIYIYKEVMSTNTVAKFLSANNVENGTVIISENRVMLKEGLEDLGSLH